MNSRDVRNKFIQFFVRNGHESVASSSLIPAQDPTLLFANAGMNQFKDVFLGFETRNYNRAVSIQKCVRAGGKHNDLDNVGFTKRHLTFFEMMGNFSFGDYFKQQAIRYAWDFLTKEINLDPEVLHVSIFETDDESYAIWLNDIKIDETRIHRLGAEHNFWQMGDIGPCGPCTEIYVDRGASYGHDNIADCGPGCDCDRFLEVWNLVFMQFDRQRDGALKLLKQTGVDTGMGLERICSVVQGKNSVYGTDIFSSIIKNIEDLSGLLYEQQNDENMAAFHVIADHIRSSTFIIADGCAPTNEGRGYVLRKIIRRAALFTQKLTDKNIFPELCYGVVENLGSIYPELELNKDLVYATLKSEIDKFSINLIRGQVILERYCEEAKNSKIITGQQAFKLYDTYGFPIEIVIAVAREKGYMVDMDGFDREMNKQQNQSGKKIADLLSQLEVGVTSEFTGYNELETLSEISALVLDDQLVDKVSIGQIAYVIAMRSPFFIVGGGQVPDQGWLTINGVKMAITQVRFIGNAIAAQIVAQTTISVGDNIVSCVDPIWRSNAMKNHTSTHLLQAALIELFGKQIQQSGSLVHPDYLRFDFTYHRQLSHEDIIKVENLVNEKIRKNIPVVIDYCTLKEAQKKGALAFFGEKYKPEHVRVVQVDEFSVELCGGTHVQATGDIGTFKITESSALSAGHRRIVAVTGPGAINLFQETFSLVKTLSQDYKVKYEEVFDVITKQKDQLKLANHTIKELRQQLIAMNIPTWLQSVEYINKMPFLYLIVPDASGEDMRLIATMLEQKLAGCYFIVNSYDNHVTFYAVVSAEFINTVDMKQFLAWLSNTQGLRCGGSKNSIQGGGILRDKQLKDAIKQWLQNK
ncbi:MAG TPA: alanine--tRNA ligase [Candidatus Babeliales bacterium]|nr:alanine--tRNA ligase [Candidatus Babeliales bacterium]